MHWSFRGDTRGHRIQSIFRPSRGHHGRFDTFSEEFSAILNGRSKRTNPWPSGSSKTDVRDQCRSLH